MKTIMHSLWLILPVICSTLTAGSPAGAAEQEPVASTPIVFTRNQVRVHVSIMGSAPFTLILDTGMPGRGIMLNPSARVDSLHLEFSGGDSVSGAGGDATVAARVAIVSEAEIGGMKLADVAIIVLPQAVLPRETEGVIGAELFERFAVRINVDKLRLDFFDSATFRPAKGSAIVPMEVEDGKAFVKARVGIGVEKPVVADLAVDLGAGHSLWLNETPDGKFAPPASAITTVLGHGLSGEIRGQVARVHRLELGDAAFEEVVAVFPVREHQNPGGFDFRDGFVGAELLTRFEVTFDYAGKRMILERGARFADPFEYDMSGMALSPRGQDRRLVDAVVKGSPAEQAGIRAGDALVAIDGEQLARLGPDKLTRSLRKEGAEVRLTLKRASETIEVRLRLRRLV